VLVWSVTGSRRPVRDSSKLARDLYYFGLVVSRLVILCSALVCGLCAWFRLVQCEFDALQTSGVVVVVHLVFVGFVSDVLCVALCDSVCK
jgi:hypothetical protein